MANEDSRLISRIDRLVSLFEDVFRESGGSTARIAAGSKSFSGSRSRKRGSADFDDLESDIKDLAKQLGETEEAFKDIESITKLIHKRFSGLSKDTEESARAFRILNAMVENSASTLEDLEEGAEDASANIWRFASSLDHNTLASKQFSSNLAKSIVNTAVFNSALFANSDVLKENTRMYDSATKGVRDAAKKLNAGILSAVDVYDKVTGELKSSLMIKDFARLNLSVANISATIDDAAQKLELKNGISELLNYSGNKGMLSNALAGDSDFKAGLDALILKMEAAGVDLSHHFQDATDETANYANAIEEIVAIHKNNSEVLEEFGAVARQSGTVLGGFTMKIQNANAAINDWVDANIKSADAIRDNAEKFGSSLMRILEESGSFNIAMIPDTFAEVQRKAIEMGMSFEQTVEYLQANKRLYAMMGGSDNFEAANDAIMAAYKRQGFNQQQAAPLLAQHTDMAVAAGINVRDTDQFTGFIEKATKNFKELSAVVGMTAEEYNNEMLAINQSQEMSAWLIGLDSERAQAMAQSNAELFKNYKLMGLSNEQAREAVLSAARRNKSSISEKFASAARASLLARQVGMSPEDAQRIQQLGMMAYKNADQNAEYEKLLQRLGARTTEYQTSIGESGNQPGYAAAGTLTSTLIGGMAQEDRDAIEGRGITAEQAARSGTAVTAEEAAAQQAAANPNQSITVLTDWANSFKSLMDNSFVAALFTGSAAVLGLALSAGKAALALHRMGGGSLGDLIPGRRGPGGGGRRGDVMRRRQMGREGRIAAGVNTRGAAGPGANVAANAARPGVAGRVLNPRNLAKGGLAGLAIGIGGGLLVDQLSASGVIDEQQTQMANAGMDIAGWAGTGAMIGSVVPGIGTAIGAGVGGLAGAAMNWDEGGKDLVQGLAKWTPMGLMARAGEHTAGLTDSIFGTNTQESLAGINQSIFGSRFTEPSAPATTPTPQEVRQQAQQDQPESEAVVNRNALSALGPEGLDPIQTLIQQLGPEKLAEAFATALAGVRITMYNPNSATTSLGYISGRQSS